MATSQHDAGSLKFRTHRIALRSRCRRSLSVVAQPAVQALNYRQSARTSRPDAASCSLGGLQRKPACIICLVN